MFATEGFAREDLPFDRLPKYVPGNGPVYKYYYTEPMKEDRFGVVYQDGSRLLFETDKEKLPYLGIWFGSGAFQNLHGMILEPCSVPLDAPDRAQKRGYTSVIPGKKSFSFRMTVSWEDAMK